MKRQKAKQKKVAFFGHFDSTNFGNESTLQAILYHIRRFQPNAKVFCISTSAKAAIETHHIEAVSISERFVGSWVPRNPLIRALRKICIGLPSEAYRWVECFIKLKDTRTLIIPGTGLLTDAYGLLGWGPYNLCKWSLIAKFCRCRLLFVSVGAGPIYGILGKWFVKSILSLADFRSYRDNSTMQYLKDIGFDTSHDRVYPDLAFSLPEAVVLPRGAKKNRRPVVGLGVMEYAGKYSIANPNDMIYTSYLENLVIFVKWLLDCGYDIRLLYGDISDIKARKELTELLRERLSACDEEHIVDEPIRSVEDLLSQIAETDAVVATRFHNVLLALLCNKPVISISFHHKCESLMSTVGLSEYCMDINALRADKLIERFCDLEKNTDMIKSSVRERVREFRKALDEQYELIFNDI